MTIRYDGSSVSVDEAQLHCRRVKASTPIVPLPRYIWYNVCSALMPIVIFNLCVYWKHCQIPMRQEIISSFRMESHVRVTHTDTHTYTAHSQWPWPMGPKYSEKWNIWWNKMKIQRRKTNNKSKLNTINTIKEIIFPPNMSYSICDVTKQSELNCIWQSKICQLNARKRISGQ